MAQIKKIINLLTAKDKDEDDPTFMPEQEDAPSDCESDFWCPEDWTSGTEKRQYGGSLSDTEDEEEEVEGEWEEEWEEEVVEGENEQEGG